MNKLQEVQLNMLRSFVEVCNKNNLRYFLIGGTCLGAVRHKGFIPWDDDIDVGMPRKDFEKFIKLQSEFPDYYFIQTYKSDPNYVYNAAKLRDSRTTYIENYYKYQRINHGVWIDILPLDGFSNKVKHPKRRKIRVLYYWYNIYMMYLPSLLRKPKKGTIMKDILLDIVAILFYFLNPFHLRNKWLQFYMTRRDFDTSKVIGTFAGTNPSKEAMPNYYQEGTLLNFEGLKVMGPKDYDGYLKSLFGDYMKLPPLDKQKGHHINSGFSLDEGYESYLKRNRI